MPPYLVTLNEPKASGQVAHVLSQTLTSVCTTLPQCPSLKVVITKAELNVAVKDRVAAAEATEKRIVAEVMLFVGVIL
jgi:hypothetical protein